MELVLLEQVYSRKTSASKAHLDYISVPGTTLRGALTNWSVSRGSRAELGEVMQDLSALG